MTRDLQNHLLFETATEVCNRVGGIYSVLKSKAPVTVAQYKDRYHLLGPLNKNTYQSEIEEIDWEDNSQFPNELLPIQSALHSMKERGVYFVYGRWLIEGSPRVILFDFDSVRHFLNEWKSDLWSLVGIPSPENDSETNDAILLGYTVAWFLGELAHLDTQHAIIAHFHEWLAGVALPLCRKRRIDVVTIFTTHATLLGRYLCAAGDVDFYNNLVNFDVDQEAGKRGIYHRYCIERAAAHTADVFTTVSHITAIEAEHLLKRKPDGILPNGLNVVKFQAVHEFQNLHALKKEKINDFVRGHFHGCFDFDLDNTLYFFIAGRYEYKNKGADMFIESLARLNYRLKMAGSKKTVVAFIIMPAKTNSFTVEALKGQAVVKALENTVSEVTKNIGNRIFDHAMRFPHNGTTTELPTDLNELLKPSDQVLLKKRVLGLRRQPNELPPIVTHNMVDDSTDPILNKIRHVQLFNASSDRVKVIFHPEFLNANNPIMGLDYDEFVRGTHLGVFPSYYEPWGYTPAECTVMGVPSITTNLSGFGAYMEDLIEANQAKDYGIYIVDRRFKNPDESVEQLVDYMEEFTKKTRRQRINQRNRTERLSDLLDWRRMGLEYVKARQLALRRGYPDLFKELVGEELNDDNMDALSGGKKVKIARPLSVPGSPRDSRANSVSAVFMTPGDLGTLQEANTADDYFNLSVNGRDDDDDNDDDDDDEDGPHSKYVGA
ncbi:similar to Saccharomyces cerevisiae YFR015C GSY1 Glycogen synthase with similarity to Gsy2p, the more highly expressed yeast homolog [Maudiozyma saulgeensis]|uniref:Glycogen [starch] synthase n=1 Tax=Maudiozyma saulgeensis TaxID=1789683 RepID=A0A1X7QZU9_9SACH|nr:similar to Saccharomyces cerevisiae YFR015C GSY1 Glycogen synthase with similarity to Gsy2p, the more highly expressed yeast homolog [Kazachstania saulgeensis]